MKKNLFYFLLTFVLPLTAQTQVLLKDINTANASSNPVQPFELNGSLLFVANEQLWKSDGTSSGTSLVFNPNIPPYNGPRFYNNYSYSKLKVNNKMVFLADGYNNSGNYIGAELWQTDGTSSGTTLLADIYSGSNSSYPTMLMTVGNYAYFTATNASTGTELYSTDGNTVNFLGDLYGGTNGNYIYSDGFAQLGNKLVFNATNGSNGYELWITDGTQGGTYMLKDIHSGSNSSYPSYLTTVGSKVFFAASNGINGTELWVTDGTESGTQMAADIYSSCTNCSSYPYNLRELNGNLIFTAQSSNFGNEIFKSDGTPSGTSMLKNIYPSFNSSNPGDLTKVGNKIFFTAENGTIGRELWVTDGTPIGTTLVKDINISNSGGDITFPYNYNQRKFFNVNGSLFFVANGGAEGYELWKSDGTNAGTTLVKDFLPTALSGNYSNFMVSGNKLYFIVEEGGSKKLCVSDGTTAGSQALENIVSNPAISKAYPLASIGNNLFFTAFHPQFGYELYKTDGTASGTSFITDLNQNTFSNVGFNFKVANSNSLIFNYNNHKDGLGLWKTNGTTIGTQQILDLHPYPVSTLDSYYDFYAGSTYMSQMVTFNDNIYIYMGGAIWKTDGVNTPTLFKGSNSTSNFTPTNPIGVANGKIFFSNPEDYELWASDGTEAGTYLVRETPGNNYVDASQMIEMNGIMYFKGFDTPTGYELWRSDGTTAGTYLVKDFISGSSSSNFFNFTKVGNKLFLSFYSSSASQYQLWVSDGTDGGTFMVANSPNSYDFFTNLNDNLLLFTSFNSSSGRELWKSDGTAGGTNIVKDIYGGSNSSSPFNYNNNNNSFAIYNNKAYFSAYDGTGNNKLYATDGTFEGTLAVSNISPNNIFSTPYGLFFRGFQSSLLGTELYKSDGTNAGTVFVADIYPGSNSSSPNNFSFNKNVLYFTANHPTNGIEIFGLRLCEENLNIATNTSGSLTFQANQVIQANNIIEPNATVNYIAGKSVQLNPGFKTDNPTTFSAKINACIFDPNTPTSPENSHAEKPDLVAISRTETYKKDIQSIPTVQEFILKNPDLGIIWNKLNSEKGAIIAELRRLDKNNPENIGKRDQLNQQLENYHQTIRFKKDKEGKITEYELTLKSDNLTERGIITVE